MRNLISLFLLITVLAGCSPGNKNPETQEPSFRFAFMTDIHLNMGPNNCFEGLEKAIEHAKANEAAFIITGGDNVDVDYLKDNNETAHELYKRLTEIKNQSGIDFHTTIGNHDRFWDVPADDPLYNRGLYEKYLGKTYYSFSHKGWHFIILDTSSSRVDDEQKAWLTELLASLDSTTPIVVSTHVPFLSVYYPVLYGEYTSRDTFGNFKEILDLFEGKNLKLVLQGHMHLYEEIKVKGIQFITAGAVSASWWGGSYYGTEEGYLMVEINGNDFSWEYVDYGWEVIK
jgi:predicted phosphodiesterase